MLIIRINDKNKPMIININLTIKNELFDALLFYMWVYEFVINCVFRQKNVIYKRRNNRHNNNKKKNRKEKKKNHFMPYGLYSLTVT